MQGVLLAADATVSMELLSLPGAHLTFFPAFYPAETGFEYFQKLRAETHWQQDTLNFGGKAVAVPRLQAWFGDPGSHYGYSGLKLIPQPWTALLTKLRDDLQQRLALPFNSVLLNLYRDGRDSVAWHSDDEPALGPDPHIASLSLGSSRRFEFKHKTRKELQMASMELENGSLLLMGSGVQRNWLHRIPKQAFPLGERINLTFRFIHAMA